MRYYLVTYGCQMNKSDSKRIACFLEKKKYKPAKDISKTDLIIVNMCSVRQSAVDRVFGISQKLSKLKSQNQSRSIKTVLTGCILRNDRVKFRKIFDEIWDKKEEMLNALPKIKKRDIIYIPISNGCNNFCSYCVVPFVRGRLICRSHKDILKEVKRAIKNAPKEIWLLGQNVNDYCSPDDPKINFSVLLNKISKIKGNFKIRFTSPNPKNFTDELIELMAKSKKIVKYLHLPLQSGNNQILKKMNRGYSVQDYKKLVKKIRKKIPQINLSTDVIVGFPGETKKQFQDTVKLFKEVKFNLAYIARYSPRNGTPAQKMKDNVSLKEKKRREKILRTLIEKQNKNGKNKKLIVILGQTATGKTDLSIGLVLWLNSKKVRKEFNIKGAEIISADSRQVYKGMDIGTGKITKKEMLGVPHYLLDIASPKRKFSVAQYQQLAQKVIKKILNKGVVPLLVGGSPFYIYSIIDGLEFPRVKPDIRFRKKLEGKNKVELFKILKKLDPKRAKNIDKNNKRRLIRAIEIAKNLGSVPKLTKNTQYDSLLLGIKKTKSELRELINRRLSKRFKEGMIEEVKKLKESGLSWKRLEEFGLEYRWIAKFLQKKINYNEMVQSLQKDIEKFAKRQMTWFKKDKKIYWIQNSKEAKKIVQDFLKK